MTLKGDAKFKGKLTCGLKSDFRNLLNFHASSWKSRNLHFDEPLLAKAYIYKDLDKKVQKSYVSWHWRMMQSLKKKLTLDSKNDMKNLVNFNLSSGKSENLHFDILLLSIAHKVSAKKVQKNYLSWHKGDPNFEEKLTFCLKNYMRNLVNFNPRSRKSKNLHFDGLLLLKLCSVWAKKIQRSCVVKNDIMISNLVNFHTSSWKFKYSVCNDLAEGMHFLDKFIFGQK